MWRTDTVLVEVESGRGGPDGRWDLWRKLRGRAQGDPDHDWSPFTVTQVHDLTVHPALRGRRVEVSFDARLSLAAVVGNLRRLWPKLRAAGWVSQTHRLGARKLALLEFVSLEMAPDTPWRTMLEGWNERHPRWRYRRVEAFEREVRRAEESLTGEAHGLEWFYRLGARLEVCGEPTVAEAMSLLGPTATDKDRRRAARQMAPVFLDIGSIIDNLTPWVRWAHERAAAGLSEAEIATELLAQTPEEFWSEAPNRDEAALEAVRAALAQDPSAWPEPAPGEARVEFAPTNQPFVWEDDHTLRVVFRRSENPRRSARRGLGGPT
jgi:hypothetical protein